MQQNTDFKRLVLPVVIALLLLSGLLFFGRSGRIPMRTVLSMAGENAPEIEAVLSAFKGDRNRSRAARFLIRNMLGKRTLDNTSVAGNQRVYDALVAYKKTHGGSYGDTGLYDVADSLEALFGKPELKTAFSYDLRTLKSDFLVRHIDESVSTWELSPWKKQVPFKTFCRYALPYREGDIWWKDARAYFREKYADSSVVWNTLGLYEAASRIEAAVRTGFLEDGQFFREHPYVAPTSFENTLMAGIGQCHDVNAAVIAALRTFGIPAAMDMVPYWGNSNAGHFWTEVIGSPSKGLYDNSQLDFHSVDEEVVNDSFWFKMVLPADTTGVPPEVELRKTRTVPKIYRTGYEINLKPVRRRAGETMPSLFSEMTNTDITSHYVVTRDVTLDLNLPVRSRYAYLCCYVPDHAGWIPVAQGRVRFGKARFKDVGVNVLLVPGIMYDGYLETCGSPFVLESSGEVMNMDADESSTTSATLFSKVPLRTNFAYYAMVMRGDRILACSRDDLSDTVCLASVDSVPYYSQDIFLDRPVTASKIIYKTDSSPLKFIAGLDCFETGPDGEKTLIEGRPFGNPCLSKYPLANVFDGNRESYAFFDRSEGKPDYIGLDFGRPRRISSLTYCPRNDDNAIVPGEDYELFYWKDGWCSLGRQKGGADRRLHYSNIPSGALLRIHNHTRGKENRPFTIEDGIQVWW